ncbi:MAG: hypothetical protein KGJ63_05220 [Pseudomonadota bacterium]|nr:hypothetical protein [Pseudomonadota bacterium]
MSHDIEHHAPPFDDDAREREWLAQETAARRERLGLDPAGDDARMRQYRRLARALREPLDATLPADFAHRVAAMVPARGARAADARFERGLAIALGVALLLAAGVVSALYGSAWLPAMATILPVLHPLADRWLLAFAACIGVSCLLEPRQRQAR